MSMEVFARAVYVPQTLQAGGPIGVPSACLLPMTLWSPPLGFFHEIPL